MFHHRCRCESFVIIAVVTLLVSREVGAPSVSLLEYDEDKEALTADHLATLVDAVRASVPPADLVALTKAFMRPKLLYSWCGKYGDWRDNYIKPLRGETSTLVWPEKKNDVLTTTLLSRSYAQQKHVIDAQCDMFWVNIGLPQLSLGDFPMSHHYRALTPHQKVNRLPMFSTHLNQKDNFALHVRRMQDLYGASNFDFHPETYIFPEDRSRLLIDANANVNGLWIAKPVLGGMGNGISLVSSLDLATQKIDLTPNILVQKYIPNPLLIDGLKFTLRLYVLVTSLSPLRIYLHETGIAKFATEKFDVSHRDNFSNEHKLMHVTNQAQNAFLENFKVDTEDATVDNIGNRRSLAAFKEHCLKMGYDYESLWARVKDTIVKSILSVVDVSRKSFAEYNLHRDSFFQLLGVDIDIDSNLKPWLIESNVCPSLTSTAAFDKVAKVDLLNDVLNLVGIVPYDYVALKAAMMANLTRILEPVVQKECGKKVDVLACLDNHDLETIADVEYEEAFRGRFERLFPTPSSPVHYWRYFPGRERSDEVATEWLSIVERHVSGGVLRDEL